MTRLTVLLGLGLAGCATWHAQPLPAPVSRVEPGTGWLRAGAASVDITPPPGVGLGGSGPEGLRSAGYRTRLYLHALVLEDPGGERIALVVGDLGHVSPNLHRLAADRLLASTGIGADRLIVSATHTHSGPAHFYAERQYNANVSRVAGYDPRLADFLTGRIVAAVEAAAGGLGRAAAAIDTIPVSGAVWNRSLEAHCRNWPATRAACEGQPVTRAVDSTLLMLRVDRLGGSGRPVPLASYSILAIHGTAIPTVNTLLDGDLHVRVVRRLAAHADSLGGRGTVHALANGAEGDVAPLVARECGVPRLGRPDPFPMPRGPVAPTDFLDRSRWQRTECLERAVGEVDRLAARIAGRAIALYDRLGERLTTEIPIRRAFATTWLPGVDSLCGWATLGSAAAAGADGAETRIRGWRWLAPGLKLGLVEGGMAASGSPTECQGPKLGLLEPLQRGVIVGEHGFPETAQLAAIRIGDLLLGAAPAEVTTEAGRRIRIAMATAARGAGWNPRLTGIVGLANGFLQYVTTAEEYQWQSYEGGSNLYGPGTAGFLARRLAALASAVGAAARGSPPPSVAGITAYPGPPSDVMATAKDGSGGVTVRWTSVRCEGGLVVGRWRDQGPGRIFPRAAPWIRIMDGARVAAEDGDGRVEVFLEDLKGAKGADWRIAWRPPPGPARSYTLARLGDGGGDPIPSDSVACGR